MADAAGGATPRSAERESARRVYFRLAAAIGTVVALYFVLVPLFDLNIAFHFYLMLWITMATTFNVAAGFSGYMPFGFVAF
jgi:branched-chain amino acid transport system permease protein